MEKGVFKNGAELQTLLAVARGDMKADCVFKNASFVDVFSGRIRTGDVAVHHDVIVGISDTYDGVMEVDATGLLVAPGFIDAHVHIESSMMTPARFQESVLPCGTTSVIWDPHEIANVKGVAGIQWALDASEGLDLDVFVMVPSCVPSTPPALELETSGASLGVDDLSPFRNHPRVLGLAEMMNFPGLIQGDDEVVSKLEAFQNMRRDGHCPGLSGKELNAYGVAGIHSCHESTTLTEAEEKLSKGIHVLVREGSCAKDADELLPILTESSSCSVGLCSDDRNPLDIRDEGHISHIINQALAKGIDPAVAIRSATYAPARMYGLNDRGAVAPGYRADLVILQANKVGDWKAGVKVASVYKSGKKIDDKVLSMVKSKSAFTSGHANLNMKQYNKDSLKASAHSVDSSSSLARVIGVRPGQILTDEDFVQLNVVNGAFQCDQSQDVLKIAVFERHRGSGRVGVGFVRGFKLRSGAIATSINHDSHNVIAVGATDEDILQAVSKLREIDGGIVVFQSNSKHLCLPLPIGGLMTDASPAEVASKLDELKELTRNLGCDLQEPFLTLSFLALPVIPTLKITDRGLVNVNTFSKVPVAQITD